MWDEEKSSSSMLGQRISSFRIESQLGAGSLAIVYRAVNEDTGETVAIKVARDLRDTPRRFYHSAELLAGLDHENIVQLRGVGEDAGAAYLVMEFISGFTLSDVLAEEGALPWPMVVALGSQLCQALSHMHGRGVLHRNIKPSHLILDEDYRLKLVGFGLATSAVELAVATEGIGFGTPGFMALNRFAGRGSHARGRPLRARSGALELAYRRTAARATQRPRSPAWNHGASVRSPHRATTSTELPD